MRAVLPALLLGSYLSGGCIRSTGVAAIQEADRGSLLNGYSRFVDRLAWARYEFGCAGSVADDRRAFDSLYGLRIAAVERFYRRHFSEQELQAMIAVDQIMVGACRRGRRGEVLLPSAAAFEAELMRTERLISTSASRN